MACDIHLYIEFKNVRGWNPHGGEMNPGRNYSLFARLAGVRNRGGLVPIAHPRGIPDDAAYQSKSGNRFYVSNDASSDRTCSIEIAEAWVNQGHSKWVGSDKKFVTDPDWHSHSWLTTDEFAIAVGEHGGIEYEVVLETMRAFEARGCPARVVFWFDN